MVEIDDDDRTVLLSQIWLSNKEREIMERAERNRIIPEFVNRRRPRCGYYRDEWTGWCPCEDNWDESEESEG
mgnify:CR=1 FL=1